MGHRLAPRTSILFSRHAVAWATSQALWLTAAGIPLIAMSSVAIAQSEADSAVRTYAIPAGSLEKVLTRFALDSGVMVSYAAGDIAGRQSPGLNGSYSVPQALKALLTGAGLAAQPQPNGGFTLRRVPEVAGIASSPTVATSDTALPPVRVVARVDAPGDLPTAFTGGQVARGGRLGLLGNTGVMDTPFNQTSYTSELIANQQATTIADVMANDPSVRVAGSGLYSSIGSGDMMMVRGFELRNRDLAFDGIYGVAPTRVFPAETLERVEVLKGPNALLNGMAPTGSIGGAVNVVPKRAGEVPLTRLTTTLATGGLAGLHLDVGRRFGDDQRWGVRFNGITREGGTAVQGQSIRMGVATVGVDFREAGLRASVDAGYQTVRTDAPLGAAGLYLMPGLPVPPPPRAERQISQDWEFSRSRSQYVMARLEADIAEDWTLYGAAGLSSNNDLFLSADKAVVDTAGNAEASAYYYPGFNDRQALQMGVRGELQTGSIRHAINLNASWMKDKNGYVLGNQYGFYNFSTHLYNAPSVPKPSLAGLLSHAPKVNDITMPTVAVADTMSWLEGRAAVTLGLRHQRMRTNDFDALTGARTPGYDESTTTPVAAVVFKLQPSLALYANYVEGLTRGPTAPAGTSNSGRMFPPSKARQMEAGVKYDMGRLGVTASVFQIERASGMRVFNAQSGQSDYRMDGEQRNRGVELQVFGEAVRGVRVLGGVAYTDARLTRTEDGVYDGRVAIAVPRWQANLSTEWDVPTLSGLTLSARLIATSAQYLDQESQRQIPGWSRWDAGVRYATKAFGKPLALRLSVENLLGRDYWMTTYDGWLNQGMPRTVLLSAAVDF